MSLAPNQVFERPEITAAAAIMADSPSFLQFVLFDLPINLAHSLGGSLWNAIRASKWAGGNGLGLQYAFSDPLCKNAALSVCSFIHVFWL